MNEQAGKIEELASQIQTLPPEIRWAAADEAVVSATALGNDGATGPTSRRVRVLITAAGRVGLAFTLMRTISIAQLVWFWWCQQRSGEAVGSAAIRTGPIFVGIRALKERDLIPQYETRVGGAAVYVDQREVSSFRRIVRPRLRSLLSSWRETGTAIFAAFGRRDLPLPEAELLTSLARRWHTYAYFLAAFRELRTEGVAGPLAFSTADLPAYAARAAGISTIYYQHGFLRRSLVFPDFDEVLALNRLEAEHLTRRLPFARLSVSATSLTRLDTTPSAAIAGTYSSAEELDRCQSFIEFCRSEGVDIIVRPHPADMSGYWNRWRGVNGVRIDDMGSFAEFILRERPRVLASWFSTTLFDALTQGVVPVVLAPPPPDLAFPVRDVALAWPQQQDEIKRVLQDGNEASAFVGARQSALFGRQLLQGAA